MKIKLQQLVVHWPSIERPRKGAVRGLSELEDQDWSSLCGPKTYKMTSRTISFGFHLVAGFEASCLLTVAAPSN